MTDKQKEALAELRLNILEDQFPYFSDEQLQSILKQCKWEIRRASHVACMMKAQKDEVTLGSMSIEGNHEFWIRLANMYRPVRTKPLKRVDEV